MITLKNVSKSYLLKNGKRHYIMTDVSLEIPNNENLAVLGPNGAGKSTLLRLIGGADLPDSGTITSNSSISWPLGLGVGFQSSLTGRQNVEFCCKINGLTKKETRQVINNVTDFAEIGDFFETPVKTYSSGMRAKLAFGLSISFNFDYYLVDELTSVGDAIFRKKAQKAFAEIRTRASIIYVSHNLEALKKSCQRALFLRKGKLDYYDNITEGIKAYKAYIREQRELKKSIIKP